MGTALRMAIGLAAVAGVVPASSAQDSRVPDPGKSAGTGGNKGISVAVPMGKVTVGPKSLDGGPVYVRRSTVREGITIVEVSTTPFMPALLSKEETAEVARSIVRPDQPAGW